MPRLIDSASRADTLTLAINHVIATKGVSGLTLRRISQTSRVSSPTIINHFGSMARVLRVAASRNAQDRLDEFSVGQPFTGLCALLPRPTERSWCTDPTVHARVWLGWLELWRTHPDLAKCLDGYHQRLANYIAVLTEGRLSPQAVNGLLALSEGLQCRMAAPTNPLPPADADALLSTVLEAWQVLVAPVRRGTPVPPHLGAALNWLRHAERGPDWRPDPELAEAFRFDRRVQTPTQPQPRSHG